MIIKEERPAIFQKTGLSIWTDPYIQENLLKAHLDLSSDAASRNQKSISAIVEFIEKNIKSYSHLLDLGCGPGLYAEEFAGKGYQVTGIDFNKKAIEYASGRGKNIKYIEGDYIKNFPHGTYDTVIMIYCDMGTHSDEERDTILRNCYNSLETGGTLVFDIFGERITEDNSEGKTWEYCRRGGFWSPEEYLLLSETFHYPENNAFAYQYNLILENETRHFIIWERYYTEEEIIKTVKDIGFTKVSIEKGLLERNNFTSSHEMFIVAEK